jgi:hypothetical protein
MNDDPLPLWRRGLATVVLLGLTGLFLVVMEKHYPIEHWMAWRYLRYWAWSLVLSLGCLGVGEALVLRLFGRIRGLHAHLFVSFSLGLLCFGLALFAAGMLQLYNRWLFWGLPTAFLAAAIPRLRILQHELLPRLRRRSPMAINSVGSLVILAFGFYALLLLYAGTMVPDNVMFDSRWKHLAIAESFASHGGIFRFDQGWMFAARPHFASYLYTWAFLIPDGDLFDRIEMCAHIEFVIVLWTTVFGIPALVRRIVPDADPKLVWVARFLFPGVFLYDANLSIGADHIGATFAIPIFITTHDFVRRGFRTRDGVLVGLMSAGIVLTKESAAAVIVPSAAVVIVVAAVAHMWKARGKGGMLRWVPGVVALGVTGLVATSPMWLKNILWYGDPLYPNLHAYFAPKPWSADSDYLLQWGFFDYQFGLWHDPEENKLWETAKVLLTWSFIPHDWKAFHGVKPVVGSLATLLLPCVILLRRTKWLWILVFWIHFGIVMWFRVLPQDRYLQVLMPFMAAFTAAVMIRAWRARMRLAIVVLVGAQIIWGGDVYFISRNQLPRLVKILGGGDDGDYDKRLRTQGAFQDVGEYLPDGARLIVHETHPHLGVRAPAYSDFQTYQFGLSYGLMKSPRELWDRYREMGITHLWWAKKRSKSWDTVAGDLMFFEFAHRYTVDQKSFGKSMVGRVPDDPPPAADTFDDRVLVLGCGKAGFPSGLYHLGDLHVPIFGPDAETFNAPVRPAANSKEALEFIDDAWFVVSDPGCNRRAAAKVSASFNLVAKRRRVSKTKSRPYELYIRKRPESPRPSPKATPKAASGAKKRKAPAPRPAPPDDEDSP